MSVSYISNLLFTVLFSFTAGYAVSIYYIRKPLPAAIISLSFALAVVCLYIIVTKKKNAADSIKRIDNELFEKCRYALMLTPERFYDEYAAEILKNNHIDYIKNGNEIFVNGRKLEFSFNYPFSGADDILKILRAANEPIAVIGIAFDENAHSLADGYPEKIKTFDLADIFKYIKNDENLLSHGVIPKKKKLKFVDFFKNSFNPKSAKKFGLYGLIMLLMSRFVFYPTIYIISGCLFITYALITIFFAPRKI